MYGDRCFKCGGKGDVFTPRGAAANAHLLRLRSRQAKDIRAGDLVRLECDFNPNTGSGVLRFLTVISAGASTSVGSGIDAAGNIIPVPGQVEIQTDRIFYSCSGEDWIRVGCTAEQKAATLAQALAFQATLTKSGKPLKP